MNALKNGIAPDTCHDGTPYTPQDVKDRMRGALPFKAALLQIRGDWEWLTQCFRFRHFGADNFCFLCDATHVGELSYHYMCDDAPYAPTLIDHERPV